MIAIGLLRVLQREIERLRAALRSAEERSRCLAEQLRDRDEEVQLLQKRVDRICSQRERDVAKIEEQNATLVRWRTYIRFLEKLIRDLRAYIISQAATSSGGSLRDVPVARSQSLAASIGFADETFTGPLQQEAGRPRVPSKERGANMRSQRVESERPESLAAVGYNLLPLPFNPYEPSFSQQAVDWPLTASRTPRSHPTGMKRLESDFTPPQHDESRTVEQLGRLMQQAAEELRATAVAARRGQSSSRYFARAPCCNRPTPRGASSPGSTEASSIGISGDSVAYPPCRGSSAVREALDECVESLSGHRITSTAAYALPSERPHVADRGCLGYREAGSLTDSGSLSDFSALMGVPKGKSGSSLRWLDRGAAAAHLAKEIAVRFPLAFDRLQKSTPTCNLLGKTAGFSPQAK